MLLVILSLLLFGCTRGPETPEEVAQVFFEALSEENYLQAAQYAEPYTAAFLNLAATMAEAQKASGELLDLPLGGVVQGPSEERGDNQRIIPVMRGTKVEEVLVVWEKEAWRVRLPESLF